MVGEPSRVAPELDFALGGLDFQGEPGGRARRRHPVQPVRSSDLGGTRQPQHHAPAARGARLVDPRVGARNLRRRDRLNPHEGIERWFEPGRELDRRERPGCRGRVRESSPIPGRPRSRPPRPRTRPRRAHLCSSRETAARARRARSQGCRMSAARLVAIVPAWNESGAIGGVVDEIVARRAHRRRRRGRRLQRRHRVGRPSPRRDSARAPVQRRHRRRGADGVPVRADEGTRSRFAWTETGSTTPPSSGSSSARSTRATPTSWSARASSTRAGRIGRPSRAESGSASSHDSSRSSAGST